MYNQRRIPGSPSGSPLWHGQWSFSLFPATRSKFETMTNEKAIEQETEDTQS